MSPPRARSTGARLVPLSALLIALVLAPGAAAQQPPVPQVDVRVADSGVVHTLRLRDGSSITGRVLAVESDTIRIETASGRFAIARTAIISAREIQPSQMVGGEYWPADPNATRLLFAPTGRMLRRGEGYFADHMLFFLSSAAGLSDRLTLGGGVTVLPLDDFTENAFVITPKIGIIAGDRVNVAAGALVGIIGGASETFGILYAVSTFGGVDGNVTTGLGYGFAGGQLADSPAILIGATRRLSRRIAFVTENYYLPDGEEQLVSYGLRFFGETLAVDMAFFNMLGGDLIFPGIPFVGFAVHF